MRFIKRTVLFDGSTPIYHLYYGNDLGDVSTLITCFPMRQSGRKGRKGAGQISALTLSVPPLATWPPALKDAICAGAIVVRVPR